MVAVLHEGSMYAEKRIVEPAALAVSLDLVKEHLRLTGTDEDATLTDQYIPAAIGDIEALTNRQLITATWRITIDRFPRGELYLPKGQLQSVESIMYRVDDYVDSMDDQDWYESTDHEPAWIRPAFSAWPSGATDVQITFVCGYGDADTDVPQSLKQAILLQTNHLWEQREPIVVGPMANECPATVHSLTNRWNLSDEWTQYNAT